MTTSKPEPPPLLRLLVDVVEHEQAADEAEAELQADGVDVERFIERVHRSIRAARTEGQHDPRGDHRE